MSCLDIYAQAGANNPLVISDLKAFVDDEEDLSIRFEGVMGSPIVCGISITKDSSHSKFNYLCSFLSFSYASWSMSC